MSGATIDISDSEKNKVGLYSTDDKGAISFYAPIKGEYAFLVRAKGYRIKIVKRAILEDGDSFEIAIARQSTEERANSKKESSAQGIVIGRNNEEEKKELVATEKRNYEYKITGSVVEINKRNKTIPLSLSKIYLTTNGATIGRTITLDNGRFSLSAPAGKHEMLIENTGHRSRRLTVEVIDKDVQLGEIALEIGEEIAAAGISSESLINRSGTRITYDVLKDPDASKINMTEMIERIPELRQSSKDGRLAYGDEKIFQILINDSENGLINSRRQYPMEFIKANYMSQIELVLPGDAEYNNDKPILLISLAKEPPYGIAGHIDLSGDSNNSYTASVDAVANTPIIGVGSGYSFGYDAARPLTDESIREMFDPLSQVITTSNTRGSESMSHNIKANLFRKFAGDKISFNASLNSSKSVGSSHSDTRVLTELSDGNSFSTTNFTKGSSESPFRINGAFRFSGHFGPQEGRRMQGKHNWSLEYKYSNSFNSNEINYSGDYDNYTQFSSTSMQEHRLAGKLVLRDIISSPFRSSIQLKAGYYDRLYGNTSESTLSNEGLDYRQSVAYFDIISIGDIVNRLGYTIVANCEYVGNRGWFLNNGTKSPLDYNSFNINPTLLLNWKLNRGMIGISYTRRVSRPKINYLNPYEDRSNPFTIRKGNPELKGEATDNYSISYNIMPTWKWAQTLNLSCYYANTNNKISRVLNTDEDAVATSTYFNLGKYRSYGVQSSALLAFSKGLTGTVRASYQWTTVSLPSSVDNSFGSPNFNFSLNWKNKYFDLGSSIFLLPSLNSVQRTKLTLEPQAELSISRYFKRPHIGVSLGILDLLHSGGMKKSEIKGNNFVQSNNIERIGRCYSFKIYWNIGKFKQNEIIDVKAYDM